MAFFGKRRTAVQALHLGGPDPPQGGERCNMRRRKVRPNHRFCCARQVVVYHQVNQFRARKPPQLDRGKCTEEGTVRRRHEHLATLRDHHLSGLLTLPPGGKRVPGAVPTCETRQLLGHGVALASNAHINQRKREGHFQPLDSTHDHCQLRWASRAVVRVRHGGSIADMDERRLITDDIAPCIDCPRRNPRLLLVHAFASSLLGPSPLDESATQCCTPPVCTGCICVRRDDRSGRHGHGQIFETG